MTDYSGSGFGGEVDWEGSGEVANRSADTPKSAIATWDSNGDSKELTGTQGDILYFGASGVVSKLSAGNSGDVLTSGGAGANPTWNTSIQPVGSVTGWLKTLTNTPALPAGWVEANGQTISDAESVYNGITMPNLNASGGGTQRFLRGSTTSGTTGGSDSHTHTSSDGASLQVGSGASRTSNSTGSTSTLPSYYEVVWIIRIK